MKIKDVVEALERFAPLPLQESYDNAGLQIGLTGNEDVSGVLLCLDVTEQVIEEAERKKCNLIVSHHPLIFRPLRRITGSSCVERCVAMALRKNIAIYSAHTNLDNAPEGVNFEIAERLQLKNVRFLKRNSDNMGGSGVIGMLSEPMHWRNFLLKVKDAFGIDALMHNVPSSERMVNTVALCGGAGDFLLDEAVAQQADAFLTGEMGYHHYFGRENEILIGVMGHYQSEQFTIKLLREILRVMHLELRVEETEVNTNPIRTI